MQSFARVAHHVFVLDYASYGIGVLANLPPPPPNISNINVVSVGKYRVVDWKGIRAGAGDTVINDATLTSDSGSVNIHLTVGWPWINTYISSVITDNGWRRADLRVSGVVPGAPNSAADFPIEGVVSFGLTVASRILLRGRYL